MVRWVFTQAEFLYAWGRLGLDRVPAPLLARPAVASLDEWRRMESELALRLPVLEDIDLLPVLKVAADPDTSIVVTGSRRSTLRLYAGITASVGVTMVQYPGPTTDTGGDIIIEVVSPQRIPKVFTAVLGEPPAGREPGMTDTWERVRDGDPEPWQVRDRLPECELMRTLLAAPRGCQGHIEVRRDRHALRPWPPQYLSWFDVEGDGRYTYARHYESFRTDPCAPRRFHHLLNEMTCGT